MKKYRKVLFVSCLSMLLLFSGCASSKNGNQGNEKDETSIYYTDTDCTRLVRDVRDIKQKSNLQQNVEFLLSQMQKTPDNDNYRLALPKDVVINSAVVKNNIVEVDFSTGYRKITENEDLLCRAAITYTLTQVKKINFVSFSISGKPMLDTDGIAFGAMNRDNFVFGDLPMKEENTNNHKTSTHEVHNDIKVE